MPTNHHVCVHACALGEYTVCSFVCTCVCVCVSLQEGLIPVPVFINGVEAHTVVRDLLTTASEQRDLARGNVSDTHLYSHTINMALRRP